MADPPPGPCGEHWGALNYENARSDIFGFLHSLVKRYGDVVRFDLGRSPHVLVHGAQNVRELFLERSASLRKPEFVKDSNRGYWGDGLTTLEGETWRERRQALRPVFGSQHVARTLPIVVQCTCDMLKTWTGDAEIDLLRELRILTARISARVVLDAEIEGYGPGEGRSGVLPFSEAYGEEHMGLGGGDASAPLAIRRPRAPPRMDVTISLIDERMAKGVRGREDLLSQLLRARLADGTCLNRDELIGEIVQILYAGHHTIPLTLASFWRAVAAHPAVASRVAADADSLCAVGDPDPSSITVTYSAAALKESIRLTPPAPLLYREVQRGFELGGLRFDPNVTVWVSPWLLHHDERYFSEPERFLPERFLDRRPEPLGQYAYLPFGTGPRTCIGSHLALLQVILTALLVAQRFNVEPVDDSGKKFWVRSRRRQPEQDT